MKKTYVLIDYENVQPADLGALAHDPFQVLVFVGANQAKVAYEVAAVLQRMGERARYIKIAGNGSNALDFHIAYYLGRLATQEPEAHFHVVSKDTGFDPLVQHLKSQKIAVNRVPAVTELFPVKAAPAPEKPDRFATVVANLARQGSARPRTLKTLGSAINALFQKSLSEAEVGTIVAELTRKGLVAVKESKVSYAITDAVRPPSAGTPRGKLDAKEERP